MNAADRVLIASIFLPAAAFFFHAQAFPSRRGARKSPCRSATRRGFWTFPTESNR